MDVTGGVVALLIGAVFLIGSRWTRRERTEKAPVAQPNSSQEERCTVRVGRSILSLADPNRGAVLLRVVPILRLRWAERGLSLPAARFTDDPKLGRNEYAFDIDKKEVFRQTLYSDRVLVVPPRGTQLEEGVQVDLEGLQAWWVERSQRPHFESRGFCLLEPEEVFLSHLTTLARGRIHELEDWASLFRSPNSTKLERFRERVIARLDRGLSVHPIEYHAEVFERTGDLGEDSAPIDATTDLVAALIYQSLAKYLKDAVTRRLSTLQLERLNAALLSVWEYSEEDREQLMRRARFWNLHDDEEAVRSVVYLLSNGREERHQLKPERRLALLLSCLEEPSRSEILNRVSDTLSDRDLGELASELANIPPCTILTAAALTDPLERERVRVVGEFCDSVELTSEQPSCDFVEDEAALYVRSDPARATFVIRHYWFFDDPVERLRRAAFRSPGRIARMILNRFTCEPGEYLWGPERIAILLDSLPASLARTLRRSLSRQALPPERPVTARPELRRKVLGQFVRRMRAHSRVAHGN